MTASSALSARSIKPGGLLIMENYTVDQIPLTSGGPKNPDMLLTYARVQADFDGFDFEIFRETRRFLAEGPRHNGEAAVVQLCCPETPMRANNRLTPQTAGIFLAIASTLIFSVQDGISKYLAQNYDVISVVMFRYWAFAVFVFALSARQKNGFRTPFRSTPQLPIQFFEVSCWSCRCA